MFGASCSGDSARKAMTEKATRFLTATFSYQTVDSCTIGAGGSFEPRYRVVHDDSGRRRDVALVLLFIKRFVMKSPNSATTVSLSTTRSWVHVSRTTLSAIFDETCSVCRRNVPHPQVGDQTSRFRQCRNAVVYKVMRLSRRE